MKTKLVLWGTNEKDEKILLGIELLEKENSINIYSFPEAEVKENFYNQLLNDWRIGNPVVFPENHNIISRPLSVTEDLLPENIKVTRTDVINRAKAEWHFVVLSSKLYQLYKSEIDELNEKVSKLTAFDKNLWEELKSFWQKVQDQAYGKNLFRSHAQELQNETNALFDALKSFRKKMDQEFQTQSKEKAEKIKAKLEEIESKMSKGLGLQPLWNDLKNIQNRFRNENLAKNDRNELWNKIDGLFKAIKEKKYGSASGGSKNNALERIQNRYKGLLAAIKKMENSIRWDKKDLNFQGDRIEETFGQLEQEIRKAKLAMIQERISSKESKLAEMMQTKSMLEEKIKKEEAKAKKQEEAIKVKQVEQELKNKIKQEIEEKNKEVDDKLTAAASAIIEEQSKGKKPEEKVPPVQAEKEETSEEPDIIEVITDQAEDIIDTIRATAKVIGGKISDAIDDIKGEEE